MWAPASLCLLTRVYIRHSYYNLQDQRCRDLRLVPSKDAMAVIESLRLVFKEEPDGFGIYCRAEASEWTLGGQTVSSAMLSFEIVLYDAPSFASITHLPLSFAAPRSGIYAGNCRPDMASAAPSLFAASCAGEADVLKVAGAAITVDVPAGTATLEILDVHGDVVLSVPAEPAVATEGSAVRVDLSGVSCGRYTTRLVPAGEPNSESDTTEKPFLILTNVPQVIGWLDLNVSRDGMASGQTEYLMAFDAISALWSYCVTSRDASARLTALAIEGDGASFQPASSPDSSSPEDSTIVLVSDAAIAMREKSPLRLKLTGHRVDADGLDQPIELSPLPMPSASTSLSRTDDGASRAEVFVYV